MTLTDLNHLPQPQLKERLTRCCGSSAWVQKMLVLFPCANKDALLAAADDLWFGLEEKDWLEAFSHHPKIGDTASLKETFANTATWAAGEQALVQEASQKTIQQLAIGNKAYEEKFGYIFIVYATGKSAEEMLNRLQSRLPNSKDEELKIAAAEQAKITRLRLEKLLA